MKTMKAGLLCVALCAAFALPAQAQTTTWTDRGFVNVSGGLQGGSRTLATATTFDIYEEAATVATSQEIEGGGFFDVSAGYKVWSNMAVGVGFSRTSNTANAALTGTVPDPVFFDRPRPIIATVDGLKHTESAIHLMAVWMIPVTETIDVALSAGPTIFNVTQDVPGSFTVTEPGPTVGNINVTSPKETSVGINLGIDVAYMITPRFGVGGLARFTRGSVDLEGASDSLSVGGFQIGGGLRVRF